MIPDRHEIDYHKTKSLTPLETNTAAHKDYQPELLSRSSPNHGRIRSANNVYSTEYSATHPRAQCPFAGTILKTLLLAQLGLQPPRRR